jgi:hypothetical protein
MDSLFAFSAYGLEADFRRDDGTLEPHLAYDLIQPAVAKK